MAFNYFLNRSREQLEADLEAAQDDLAAGKATFRVGAGDVSSESRVDKSAEERIKQILKALNKIDPVAYPIADITPIDRTRVTFYNPDSIPPAP